MHDVLLRVPCIHVPIHNIDSIILTFSGFCLESRRVFFSVTAHKNEQELLLYSIPGEMYDLTLFAVCLDL